MKQHMVCSKTADMLFALANSTTSLSVAVALTPRTVASTLGWMDGVSEGVSVRITFRITTR